jgi:desulfoferrodoxin (superoxide reductase-like protein)
MFHGVELYQGEGGSMRFIIIALALFMMPLLAHPPNNLNLKFDTETGVLSIAITHSVNDASRHYIKKVEVELNGQKIIEQSFMKQSDNEEQQVLYKIIDAKKGDNIAVEAYCNISGKKKAQLVVTDEMPDAGDD